MYRTAWRTETCIFFALFFGFLANERYISAERGFQVLLGLDYDARERGLRLFQYMCIRSLRRVIEDRSWKIDGLLELYVSAFVVSLYRYPILGLFRIKVIFSKGIIAILYNDIEFRFTSAPEL